MKLHFVAGEHEFLATAVRSGNVVTVTPADGVPAEFQIVSEDGGELILERSGRRYHMIGVADGARRHTWLNGRTLTYRRQLAVAHREAAADLSLTSTIPAVVLEILVKPGDSVHEGQKLLLLESMKMVMPIVASRAARVAAILFEEGDAVQPGVPLIELEDVEQESG